MGLFSGPVGQQQSDRKTLEELEYIVAFGDTRLQVKFASEIHVEARFKLGSIARFVSVHGTVLRCRYVCFSDGIPAGGLTRAVGQLVSSQSPWTATHDPAGSSSGMILGLPMVDGPLNGPVYGWVQIDGIRDLDPDAGDFTATDTLYWAADGTITLDSAGSTGIVGIALSDSQFYVAPWFGQPKESVPPYTIAEITGLQTILDNLAAATGDMQTAVYDQDGVAEQLVGLTAIQTLLNKSLVSPAISNPTGLVKADVGLGNVTNDVQLKAADLDNDMTLAADSATKIPSQHAVKSYIAAFIAAQDVMVFKGVIDCSASPNYPAADAGATYVVSVAGKIGGASGTVVEAGDSLMCLVDSTASGNQATVGANWAVIQKNIDGAVVGPASVTDGNPTVFNGTTGKVVKQVTFAAFKTSLVLVKGDVGLGNVDNTSDANKPVSTAQAAAIRNSPINDQTASYTAVLTDAGKTVYISNASANTFTIPPNSSVAFAVGDFINVVQSGAGATTITAGSGVTIRNRNGLKSGGQYALMTVTKHATDEWYAGGDLTT